MIRLVLEEVSFRIVSILINSISLAALMIAAIFGTILTIKIVLMVLMLLCVAGIICYYCTQG